MMKPVKKIVSTSILVDEFLPKAVAFLRNGAAGGLASAF